MAGVASTYIRWCKDDATVEELVEACVDPKNETELYVICGGLTASCAIGAIWVASKLIKGGAKIYRFLKR